MPPTGHIDDFRFGADVYASDGVHVGTLDKVIVDEESLDVHALVVKETRRFSGHHLADGATMLEDDIAVPIAAAAQVTRERIDLSLDAAALRRLPPYLTYQYAPLTKAGVAQMALAMVAQAPFGAGVVDQANKRPDELEVRPGENVMLGRTGRKLGTVRDIVMDGGELIGIVVRPTGFFKDDVLVQVRFLGRSDDLALFVHMTERDIENLQPFHPAR